MCHFTCILRRNITHHLQYFLHLTNPKTRRRRFTYSAGGSDQKKSPAVAPSAQHQQSNNHFFRRRTGSPNPSSDSPPSIPARSESDLHLRFWQPTRSILLVMALSFLGIVILLFVTLESDYTSHVHAATSQDVEVSYGSVMKLMHEKTKFRLHSHPVPYGSGSGQQSVTSFPKVNDANSYWIVRPAPETSVKHGESIKTGTIIRLQHLRTRKWLHSHLHASPLSGNLEVSCFGDDGSSDSGDNWKLEIEGSGETWKQYQKIRLVHVETNGYLHSHDKKYRGIAGGQQEVCGVKEKSVASIWLAVEGIFFTAVEK